MKPSWILLGGLAAGTLAVGAILFAFEGDPNIVEVYIRHLRRKLDEPFGKQLIETIRGSGYRLDPEGG